MSNRLTFYTQVWKDMEAQAKSTGVSMPECLGFLVTNLGCTENQVFQHQSWIQGQLT